MLTVGSLFSNPASANHHVDLPQQVEIGVADTKR
jgi:hypothetical protein